MSCPVCEDGYRAMKNGICPMPGCEFNAGDFDAHAIVNALADVTLDDKSFWILTSVGAYLNGHDLNDGDGSTVATFFPEWFREQFGVVRS
jgi:hypothetical protein